MSFLIGERVGDRRTRVDFINPPVGEFLGPEGSVDVCLQTRSPHAWEHEGRFAKIVEGEVIAVGVARNLNELPGALVRCSIEPQWYFEVRDSIDERWRFLYAVSNTYAISNTKLGEPNLQIGTKVTVNFRAHWGFAKAAGFMVSDTVGPVLGLEQGEFGHGLAPGDILPFIVRTNAIGLRRDHCGDAVINAVDIVGDSEVRVLPGRYGLFGAGAMRFNFWNACSYSWANVRCTDMLSNTSWLLSRVQAAGPSNKPLQQAGSPQ